MNSNRIWVIGAAVLAVLVIALGWFLGIAPRLASAGLAEIDAATVDLNNQTQEQQLAALKADFEKVEALRKDLDALRVSVPPYTNYPEFWFEIDDLADDTKMQIVGTQTGVPEVAKAEEEAPPAAGETPAETPAEGEEAPAAPAPPAEKPVADADTDFVAMPVTVTVRGTVTEWRNFLGGFLELDRLTLVTNYTLEYKPADDEFEGKVSAFVYVLLDDSVPGQGQGEVPAGELPEEEEPAVEPTPAPTGVPAPTPTATQTPAP